ncbi:MAG: PorP/SprF family type IX secretion system membrane protein [bacterium]
MKKIILYIILLCVTTFVNTNLLGQQVSLYSQYMMNKFLINPAVAGAEGYTAINLTSREQWIGFGESPGTHAISLQSRILRNSFISKSAPIRKSVRRKKRSGRVGLGGYIYNDRSGIINKTGFQFTYAYHIHVQQSQISFGVSMNTYQFRIKKEDLNLYDAMDQLIYNNKLAIFIPDANIGFYYSDRSKYFGFSGGNLFESLVQFSNNGATKYETMKRHYYLMGGHFFNINEYMILEPSFLLKTNELLNNQLEICTRFFYRENYWGGISYRTGSYISEKKGAETGSIILMGGVKLDKFFFGYAFDYTLSDLMHFTYGTHEIMAAIKFGDSARRYRWLNRY